MENIKINRNFNLWWDDLIINQISHEFFELHQDWLVQPGGQCERWILRLYMKGKTTRQSAEIIKRAFYLFCFTKKQANHHYFFDTCMN